jgi:hypothetical protein
MSVEKSELRASAVHDLGARLDDGLEKVLAEKHEAVGAAAAHNAAVDDITVLKLKVKDEIEAGKLDLDQAKLVLDGLERAAVACRNLRTQASARMLKADGAVVGMKVAIEMASQAHTQELAKGQERESKGEDGERRVPIKARRQAEDKKPAAKKTAVKKKAKKKASAKKKAPAKKKG